MARLTNRAYIDELLAEPFPGEWESWLTQNLYYYPRLSSAEQERLRNDARVLVAEKHWEGCDGLKVTELMKLTVAAQAAVLVLGLEHDYFSRVRSVVLFPAEFELPAESWEERGRTVTGQAVDYGAVYLSWATVLAEAREPATGHNLVIHEFAHQLDFLDGYTNGAPPLRNREQTRRWHMVMQGTFHRLRRDLQHGLKPFLDDYAATNPTEFFSVVSENFFSLPAQLHRWHPDLFAVLAEYYRVDPRRWFDGNDRLELPPAVDPKSAPSSSARPTPEPAESGFIDYPCPYCQHSISFPGEEAGKLKPCPNCQDPARVPERSGLPPAPIRIPLRTQRLALRRLETLDANDLTDITASPETLRYVKWTPMTLEQVEEWIAYERGLRFPQAGRYFFFAIELAQTRKVIAVANFWLVEDDFDLAQFEIVMHPKYHRQGFATEAVRSLLGFAFADMGARRVVAQCDSRNQAARKLLSKAGMRQESECLQDRFLKQEWVNTVGFALLRSEFEGQHPV